VKGPQRTVPTVKKKLSTVSCSKQSAFNFKDPCKGPFLTIAVYMLFRSRLRAFLTASRGSGKTIKRRFGKPRAAKEGETSGRPIEACNFARTLSMRHSARVHL